MERSFLLRTVVENNTRIHIPKEVIKKLIEIIKKLILPLLAWKLELGTKYSLPLRYMKYEVG